MTAKPQDNNDKNLAIWKTIYGSYEKGTLMPGTQYPNLRLVDFIRRWRASPHWPTGRRPRVLELGFGSIANMRMMALEGCDVHGLEVSEDAVQSATKAIEAFGLSEHLSADYFETIPLAEQDGSYDAIVGLQCVYNNLDQSAFADECARILTPGGLVFFSFFTTHHGYMRYINGQPGGVVSFTNDHPNPRLPGLEVFLYRDKAQLQEIYGGHFDVNVEHYETDLLAVFQSWHYLRGQKIDRPDDSVVSISGSQPTSLSPPDCSPGEGSGGDAPDMMAANILVLEKHSPTPDGTVSTVLQDYPNVEIVRFLATWNRRQENDYFHTVGKEISTTQVQDLAALEINTSGPSHLIAMDRFNYHPHGVCLGKNIAQSVESVLADAELGHAPTLKIWDGTSLPFEARAFDVTFSLASNLVANQTGLVGEVARTMAEGGEIFMAYVSPRAGILKNAEHVGGNFYRLQEDFDEPNFTGMTFFVASDDFLKVLWKDYFDITINRFEYSGQPYFQSFQVVTGKRNGRVV